MSLAQRLAWLDGVSTLAVLATAIAVWSPATDDPVGSLWRLAARVGIVAAVCLGAFYYNDLYDFEAPHDAGQLFTRLCRALGFAALLSCRFRGVRVEEGTEAYERFTRRLAVESLTPSGLIFGDGFRVSRAQLALKRGMSVVIASIALVAMAPLIALIALGIKLESRGPVFFIQE